MFDTILSAALPLAFTLFVACFLTSLICGLALLLFKLRKTNEALQHPYLKQRPFGRFPIGIRTAILMDYFFRLNFPRSQFWVVGQANQLLAHVQPDQVPQDIKWPLLGLWGGCFVGLVAMAATWIIVFIKM